MPILDVNPQNPLVDGRQSERALAVRRGVLRHLRQLGMAVLPELPLASGRRADLIGMDGKGRFIIIEIKSSIADYRADTKWTEYLAHCDEFFFATHVGVPQEIFPPEQGLLIADAYGAEMLRPSIAVNLSGATRKALSLRFARAAAWRLERILSHCESIGEALPGDLNSPDSV